MFVFMCSVCFCVYLDQLLGGDTCVCVFMRDGARECVR